MAQKAIFLDRDDTLIDDPGYIQNPEQVRLLPGAAQALVMLKNMGYLLIVVTNQSGIARGMITEEQLEKIHSKFKSLLAAENAWIDQIYYCPYHPDGEVKDFSIESNLRKPNAGMLFQAEEELDIDLSQSWMIGDSYRDIQAGKAAGCHTILVDVPGKIREKKTGEPEPDRKAVNLREAVNIIRMFEFHQRAHSAKQSSKQNSDPPAEQPEPEPVPASIYEAPPMLDPIDPPQIEEKEPYEETPPTPVDTDTEPQTKAEAESQTEKTPTTHSEPDKVYTTKKPPASKPPHNGDNNSETSSLLEEIAHRLRNQDREGLYQEFSVFKLLSMMIQVVAIVALVTSVCYWFARESNTERVMIMLGYSIALQLLVIALLMMHSKDK